MYVAGLPHSEKPVPVSSDGIKRQLPEDASSADISAFLRDVRDGQIVARDAAIQLLHCRPGAMRELLATACS